MTGTYATKQDIARSADFSACPTPAQIVAELETAHGRELRKLSDLAFVFLNATDGDSADAQKDGNQDSDNGALVHGASPEGLRRVAPAVPQAPFRSA